MPDLRSVSLRATGVTGPGLEHLHKLPQLASLDLRASPVTDEGLAGARGLRCLTRLELEGTKVTGPGLKHLAGMPRLSYLSLDPAQVTDAALGALGESKMLHVLPRVRGAGSNDRPGSPDDIRHLDLSNTAVTDDGLKYLARLENITSVNLSHTKVTDTGVAKLQAALPGCKIDR